MWGVEGCRYYGFLALFLGFCQMHVPVLVIVDAYMAQGQDGSEQVEKVRRRRRMLLVAISFLVCLFFGAVPLFAWTPIDFEPGGLSCSVYQETPDMAYMTYIGGCFLFFELIPLTFALFCKSRTTEEAVIKTNSYKVTKSNKMKRIKKIDKLIILKWIRVFLIVL